jgi:hypothetical protein
MNSRYILLGIIIWSNLLNCQAQNNKDSVFYYYHGQQIQIPLSKSEFMLYFEDSVSAQRSGLVSEKTFNSPTMIHCKRINSNYDSTVATLKKIQGIKSVEPVIGHDKTTAVSNIFYVKLKHESDFDKLKKLADSTHVAILRRVKYTNRWYALQTNIQSMGNSLNMSNLFWETGWFEAVDPGFIFHFSPCSSCVTDSSFSSKQWNMQHIHACDAWNLTTGNPNVKVAVIDEGVNESHREFSNTAISYSYDVQNNQIGAHTYGFHGTFVGGIIFAGHNDHQVAGVAPDVSIINLSHSLKESDTLAEEMKDAIHMAVNQQADVINCSWTDKNGQVDLFSPLLEEAIDSAIDYGRNGKGCVVVFAAGNYHYMVEYPGNYRKEILTVGASTQQFKRWENSGIGSANGDNLDVMAPGDNIYSTSTDYTGYKSDAGTSYAAPHVSGIAALMLSVNPNLTGQQVRDIIETTAQRIGVDNNNKNYIYSNSPQHPNGTWNFDMGYGIVDAYAAVQKAVNHHNDLYIRDTVTDDGSMPSSCYSTWDSPDIWMQTLDGQYVAYPHGNTKYAVCVKIHNRRDVASSGTEKLFLNWSKAGFNDRWDEYWTGNNPLPCGAPKGGVIGSANGRAIPSIPANSYRIDTIHWTTPAGEDYAYCTDFNHSQWHFCLLARIHDDDVIAHENERLADVHQLVRNHNNVAQQNVCLDSAENYQNTLGIWNVTTIGLSRIINLSPKEIGNISITDFAEVYITLDAGLLMAINSANITGLTWVNGNTLRWNGGSASIPVTLPANSYYTLKTTVNFLADQIPANNNFDFDIVLRSATGDSILGGEHYKCVRTNGRWFEATITATTSGLEGDPVVLTATDINEDADYQWYDEQGNNIGNGLTCIVYPLQNTTYTLRVTADADGYRAYGTELVNVTEGELRQLTPNPADNQVRIGYALSRNVSAATLQILNGSGQVVYSQALSGGNGSKVTGEAVVNTSSLAAGSYTVRLISSGNNIYDNKTLVIR